MILMRSEGISVRFTALAGRCAKAGSQGLLPFLAVLLLIPGISSAQQGADKVWKDSVYKDDIHTVRLYQRGDPRSYPLYQLGGAPLRLSFDKFSSEINNYTYKIEHCSPTWQSSGVSSQIYLSGMRRGFIDQYQHSFNTYFNYVHYTLQFPNRDMQPKIPGNYILKVYDDDDQPVFTRRFYVASEKVNISATLKQASFPEYRDTRQQLNFTINYQGVEDVSEPFRQFRVVIRQNGRDDNAIRGLKPRYVEGQSLIYNYQEKNLFKGGNEFRPLDIRSLDFGGQGVRKIELDSIYTAHLTVDESRAYQTHVNYNDNNGRSLTLTANRERANLKASYLSTYFYLDANPRLNEGEAIYVFGGLSDWQIKERYKMQYLPDKGVYYANMLLKQGYYDYKYAISRGPGTGVNTQRLEGSHFETENEYIVLVYFKDPFRNIFKLVGARTIKDGLMDRGQ